MDAVATAKWKEKTVVRRDMKKHPMKLAESFRMSKIVAEFVNAIETLDGVHNAVGVFGSARTKPYDPYYESAARLGRMLAEAGFSTVTGGGPGIMEAANKGAYMASGTSVGLNIDLPFEQHHNTYQTVTADFKYFFIRKVMFVKNAVAIVVYPGGYGTFDEMFEVLTLMQTRKSKVNGFKFVLVGSEFWRGLIDWLKGPVLESGMISPEDLELFKVMDDPRDVVDYIRRG